MKDQFFPEIETARLHLRQFRQDDLENVFSGLSHPEIIKFYGVNYKSLKDTEQQMKWFRDLENTGTGIWWAITAQGTKAFLGGIGINNLRRDHRKAEIGFWLFPEYWRKGIVQEAAREVLEYCFSSIGLHRIEAFVEENNENSERLLKKLNFEMEGILRDWEIKNGQFTSFKVFAKLNK